MLGHLVSNRAAPVLHAKAPNRWLKRLIAILFRRT
jgi:hypothetical protein